jgi:3',5'-cyclic AMP phosphodiesterase CpdA
VRLLHCSDIHLLDLAGSRPRQFVNKRLTGGVNLLLKRGRAHDGDRFDRILEHARALSVDRVVITGDLTNLALPSEFEHVRARLAGAGVPVTVIPGNHDAYTRGSVRSRRFEAYLGGWMEGERGAGRDYPFVQRFPGVGIIGLSTAIATAPLMATGQLGGEQLDALSRALRQLREEGRARVVLIHHPVVAGVSKARHDLLDLPAFGQVIAREGADVVLHGHEHEELAHTLAGPEDVVPVFGIASGTSRSHTHGRQAAFAVLDVEPGGFARETWRWVEDGFARHDVASLASSG